MSEYTPTTEEVARDYSAAWDEDADLHEEDRARALARFYRWLAAHDAEVRAGVVTEEPEWAAGVEYGYVDFEHGLIPLVTGYEGITHARLVRYGPWVPVKQQGADDV